MRIAVITLETNKAREEEKEKFLHTLFTNLMTLLNYYYMYIFFFNELLNWNFHQFVGNFQYVLFSQNLNKTKIANTVFFTYLNLPVATAVIGSGIHITIILTSNTVQQF